MLQQVNRGLAIGALICLPVLIVIAFVSGESMAGLVVLGIGVLSVALLILGSQMNKRRGSGE